MVFGVAPYGSLKPPNGNEKRDNEFVEQWLHECAYSCKGDEHNQKSLLEYDCIARLIDVAVKIGHQIAKPLISRITCFFS